MSRAADKQQLPLPQIPPLDTSSIEWGNPYEKGPHVSPENVGETSLGEDKTDSLSADTFSTPKEHDCCSAEAISDRSNYPSVENFFKTEACAGNIPQLPPSPPLPVPQVPEAADFDPSPRPSTQPEAADFDPSRPSTQPKAADFDASPRPSTQPEEVYFVPKFENISARERKLRAFRGQSCPITHHIAPEQPPPLYPLSKMIDRTEGSRSFSKRDSDHRIWETESVASANDRKRSEQQSHIFDDFGSVSSRAASRCPTNLPEATENNTSTTEATERRRKEANYSDLFGRTTPKGWRTLRQEVGEPTACSADSSARERYLHEMGSQLSSIRNYGTTEKDMSSDHGKEATRKLRDAHARGHKEASLIHHESSVLCPTPERVQKNLVDYEAKFQNLSWKTTDKDLKQLARECGCFMSRVSVDWDPIANRGKGGGYGILKVEDAEIQLPHFEKAILQTGASVRLIRS